MDWKVSSKPLRWESSVRKENTFIPQGAQMLSQKKVEEILNYREPMRTAQNMETRIEKNVLPVLPNSGDCVSVALMGAGSTTVHVQRMRVMSTEINFAVPTSADGYQIYCPPSNACLMHEGRNIFIIQEDPADLFISSKICDSDITMKPKHTMKSHVLNPEAKEFIPLNLRKPQTNCKSLSVDENNSVNNISNKPVEYINARDKLFSCSSVASENFKVEINKCSPSTHEQAPLIMESTSSDNKSENTCTCPVSSNLSDDEQTKESSDQDLLMALTECLSLYQFPENELKVTASCSVDIKPESDINNSDLGKTKHLGSLCKVMGEESVVEGLCSKNESCGDCNREEPDSVTDKSKLKGECRNLEIDNYDIVFIASDEVENCEESDDDLEDEESSEEDESSDDDEMTDSEEEESSDETEDEENEEGINESDDDDDVTICFTVDDTEESDNESDVQDYDDADFEIDDEDNDGNDYACDLFQVEFNDDEVRIPMNGLGQFITDLLSQSTNSCTSDGMVDFLNSTDEFDDVDSSGFLEERDEILQANKRWNDAIDLNCCSSTPAKVKFSDDVEIYSADDCCRKSPWEVCARDRMRFQRRIEETESILNRILSPEHRCKVLSRLQTMEKM